jgi:hypothetical protein
VKEHKLESSRLRGLFDGRPMTHSVTECGALSFFIRALAQAVKVTQTAAQQPGKPGADFSAKRGLLLR